MKNGISFLLALTFAVNGLAQDHAADSKKKAGRVEGSGYQWENIIYNCEVSEGGKSLGTTEVKLTPFTITTTEIQPDPKKQDRIEVEIQTQSGMPWDETMVLRASSDKYIQPEKGPARPTMGLFLSTDLFEKDGSPTFSKKDAKFETKAGNYVISCVKSGPDKSMTSEMAMKEIKALMHPEMEMMDLQKIFGLFPNLSKKDQQESYKALTQFLIMNEKALGGNVVLRDALAVAIDTRTPKEIVLAMSAASPLDTLYQILDSESDKAERKRAVDEYSAEARYFADQMENGIPKTILLDRINRMPRLIDQKPKHPYSPPSAPPDYEPPAPKKPESKGPSATTPAVQTGFRQPLR